MLSWLAFSKIPPFVTSSSYFRNMLEKVRDAGASYTPPSREAMGMDRGRLGAVLQLGLDRAREARRRALAGIKYIKVDHVYVIFTQFDYM